MNLKRTKKGFTIVELVIVVGVIGILSAILIPTFVNLTENARKSALQLNLRNAYSLVAEDLVDGYVGTTETEDYAIEVDLTYSQAEVRFVSKETGATAFYKWGDDLKYVDSKEETSGWMVITKAYNSTEKVEYNGYYAYLHVSKIFSKASA